MKVTWTGEVYDAFEVVPRTLSAVNGSWLLLQTKSSRLEKLAQSYILYWITELCRRYTLHFTNG